MTRTFISLEMNEMVQRQLADVIRQLTLILPSVRWVNPASIHLTLAFLGELDHVRLAEAMRASTRVAQNADPFNYTLTQLGIFGPLHQPRAIWMGIAEPTKALLHLQRTLNRELELRGLEIDHRPFSPHLTIAYIRSSLMPQEQKSLQEMLVGDHLISTDVYRVTSIQVMKSELSSAGAHYTRLRTCKFGEK
jgi:2'-5' RNA ligase